MKTPKLREHVDRLVSGADQRETRLTDEHAAYQLAQHRRLTDPLGQQASQLGGTQHDHQYGKEL